MILKGVLKKMSSSSVTKTKRDMAGTFLLSGGNGNHPSPPNLNMFGKIYTFVILLIEDFPL